MRVHLSPWISIHEEEEEEEADEHRTDAITITTRLLF